VGKAHDSVREKIITPQGDHETRSCVVVRAHPKQGQKKGRSFQGKINPDRPKSMENGHENFPKGGFQGGTPNILTGKKRETPTETRTYSEPGEKSKWLPKEDYHI